MGLNLGPNLFITGSLAWNLWLRAADTADAQPSISQLEDSGRVSFPSLNFDFQQLSPTDAALKGVSAGVLVLAVTPGSPEDRAGLVPGDVVTAVAGQALDPGHPLQRLLRGLAVHQTVTVAVHPVTGSDRNISMAVELASP